MEHDGTIGVALCACLSALGNNQLVYYKVRLSLGIGTDQAQALLSRVVQRSDDQPGHGEDGLELGVGRSQRPRLSSFGVAIATTPRRATDRSQRA